MIIDRWLSGEVRTVTAEVFNNAVEELQEQTQIIDKYVNQERYWDAYKTLTTNISFFNAIGQQQPVTQPQIVQSLLNWIQKIGGAVGKIVKGLGGNGYSITVSAPLGVSVTISFPA